MATLLPRREVTVLVIMT